MQPSVPTGRAVDSAGTPASDLWTCDQERQPGRGRDDGACARQDLTRKSPFAVRWRVWTGRSESRNRSTPPARCHVGRHLARPRYVAHSRASSGTGRDAHGDSSGVLSGSQSVRESGCNDHYGKAPHASHDVHHSRPTRKIHCAGCERDFTAEQAEKAFSKNAASPTSYQT